jgi:phosphoribosyl 1,2-cyclic phosphate phosphodiesterase
VRVVLLGTGASAGVPMLGGADGHGDWGVCDPAEPRNRRTRASIAIETPDGGWLLVDTGPDMRAQLLAAGIGRVEGIVFTHAHADHITGIDDVRILNRLVGRPIEAFAMPETLEELSRRFDYAFRPWQPPHFFRPVLETRPVEPGETFAAAGLTVQTFAQDHGYLRTLGLRIGAFAYSTDAVALDEDAFATLAGVETWVIDCFQRAPAHKTHAHLDVALAWARRVGARRTILTHMGNDMDWAWLRANLPAGVEPGHDGMLLDI